MSAKYIHLANILREIIFQNTGKGIYKLPSEHELCAQYHLSRQTVRAALHLLTEEGLIEKRQGSGSFSTGLGTRENTIGIIVNNADEYTTPALLADLKSVFREKGYTAQIYSTYSKIAIEREILENLRTAPIRGLIVEGTKTALPNPNLDLYEYLMEKGVAIVFAGGNYPALTSAVYIKDDNYYGGYLLAKHFIQQGHTQIAGIFKIDDMQGLERYFGFVTALRDFKITVAEELILWYTSAKLEALETRSDTGFLTSFLRRNKSLCSAIICHNDEIAYWLIRELRYADIRVPEDISVVSFDNSYMSDLDSIRITTLSHGRHELGKTAACALLRMIQGETVFSEELPWRLVSRGSDCAYGQHRHNTLSDENSNTPQQS